MLVIIFFAIIVFFLFFFFFGCFGVFSSFAIWILFSWFLLFHLLFLIVFTCVFFFIRVFFPLTYQILMMHWFYPSEDCIENWFQNTFASSLIPCMKNWSLTSECCRALKREKICANLKYFFLNQWSSTLIGECMAFREGNKSLFV